MSIFKINLNIEKSIVLETNIDNVWDYITDTDKKTAWSPRLILEKNCKQTTKWRKATVWYLESWDWAVVWSGEQIITEIVKNEYIYFDLNFLKPFKSSNKASFVLEKISDTSTKLTWKMQWTLPILLFFLKKMMTIMVVKDFERGLLMLKTILEKWKLDTSTEFSWVDTLEKKFYIWTKTECNHSEIWTKIGSNFSSLINITKEHNLAPLSYFTIYNKADIVNDKFEIEACIEISENDFKNFKLPIVSTYFLSSIDKMKVAVTTHYGSYDFIDNSWTWAYMYLKPNKLKKNSKYPAIELYEKWFVDNIDESKYVTHIIIPVK